MTPTEGESAVGSTASHPAGVDRPAGGVLLCPSCTSQVAAGERFCEACGADLGLPAPAAPQAPAATAATPSAGTPPGDPAVHTEPRACHECGGVVAEDGYCTSCGAPASSARNHFSEQPAPWVAGVCDRGIRHPRNEDAVALAAAPEPGGHAVLVVCDGVSSSTDSDVASLAAARAARDVLASSPPVASATVAGRVAAGAKALVAAADAADEAVIAHTTPGSANPAACTFVAAVLDVSELVVGWVGDSRAYWVPDRGTPLLLTTDDSYAAEQIAQGVPRAAAESGPQAHAITRWLGIDAPDHTPRTASLELDGPGWVLVCSDGLWNYCSEARDVAGLVAQTCRSSGAEPLDLAGALVAWANDRGGQDNITVALARVGPTGTTAPPTQPVTASAPGPTAPREEVQPHGHVLS